MSSNTIKNPSSGHISKKSDHNTREQLLDAATVLFAEQGIASTTVAQIATHVGVTSAMVHYYFKTRDQLLNTVIEERIKSFLTYVWDPVTEREDDPFILAKDIVIRIIKASDLMPWIPQLWSREIVNEGGTLREKMIQHIPIDKLKQFEDCIAAAQKRGIVNPDIDPRWLLISIIGLTMLPLVAVKIFNRAPNLVAFNKDDLARHVIALLMRGLANPSLGDGTNSG